MYEMYVRKKGIAVQPRKGGEEATVTAAEGEQEQNVKMENWNMCKAVLRHVHSISHYGICLLAIPVARLQFAMYVLRIPIVILSH